MKGNSLANFVGLIVGLFLFVALYPTIQDRIDSIVPIMDPFSASFLQLIPFIWLIIFLLFILAYLPGGGNEYEYKRKIRRHKK